MRIKSKVASIIWKVIFVCAGTWGLLDGSGILRGAYTPAFPHMFTNISNLFAWGYFICAIIWLLAGGSQQKLGAHGAVEEGPRVLAPTLKYTATVSLLVTMLIGHFMLQDALFQDGQLVWHLVVLHYVVPIMVLLDWLLFDEKGEMPMWGPFAWLWLVLAYLAFTMVAVGVLGLDMGGGTTADITRYPYTFLDPAISGVGGVATFCAVMAAAFVALGFVLWGIDRLLGRMARR